jgi:SAM-dependent methyltransferase
MLIEPWIPPSNALNRVDGLWCGHSQESVSYPDGGNEACFQVEDGSYWFAHRNRCLIEVIQRFPPNGLFYDVGGGNGFVSADLEAAGIATVLVEPGTGARNALNRGLPRIIQGTLESCEFHDSSLDAVGAFDVVEHIKDDSGFLQTVHRHLRPGGRIYLTVPASAALWSAEDVSAGHFRRYSSRHLCALLENCGYEVEYMTYFFSWLLLPLWLLRTLPYRLFRKSPETKIEQLEEAKRDHTLPPLLKPLVNGIHRWELNRLRCGKTIPFGTSLLVIARTPQN